jgi:hypothetical protein
MPRVACSRRNWNRPAPSDARKPLLRHGIPQVRGSEQSGSWNRQAKGKAPPERILRPDGTNCQTHAAAHADGIAVDTGALAARSGRLAMPGVGSRGTGPRAKSERSSARKSASPRLNAATRTARPATRTARGASPGPHGPDAKSITMPVLPGSVLQRPVHPNLSAGAHAPGVGRSPIVPALAAKIRRDARQHHRGQSPLMMVQRPSFGIRVWYGACEAGSDAGLVSVPSTSIASIAGKGCQDR